MDVVDQGRASKRIPERPRLGLLPEITKVMLEIDGAAYAQRLISDLTNSGFLPSP